MTGPIDTRQPAELRALVAGDAPSVKAGALVAVGAVEPAPAVAGWATALRAGARTAATVAGQAVEPASGVIGSGALLEAAAFLAAPAAYFAMTGSAGTLPVTGWLPGIGRFSYNPDERRLDIRDGAGRLLLTAYQGPGNDFLTDEGRPVATIREDGGLIFGAGLQTVFSKIPEGPPKQGNNTNTGPIEGGSDPGGNPKGQSEAGAQSDEGAAGLFAGALKDAKQAKDANWLGTPSPAKPK
jgi:hypothetical protein